MQVFLFYFTCTAGFRLYKRDGVQRDRFTYARILHAAIRLVCDDSLLHGVGERERIVNITVRLSQILNVLMFLMPALSRIVSKRYKFNHIYRITKM